MSRLYWPIWTVDRIDWWAIGTETISPDRARRKLLFHHDFYTDTMIHGTPSTPASDGEAKKIKIKILNKHSNYALKFLKKTVNILHTQFFISHINRSSPSISSHFYFTLFYFNPFHCFIRSWIIYSFTSVSRFFLCPLRLYVCVQVQYIYVWNTCGRNTNKTQRNKARPKKKEKYIYKGMKEIKSGIRFGTEFQSLYFWQWLRGYRSSRPMTPALGCGKPCGRERGVALLFECMCLHVCESLLLLLLLVLLVAVGRE